MRQSRETTSRSSAIPMLLKSRFYHPLPKTSSLGKPSLSFLDVFFLLGTLLLTFCLSLAKCFPKTLAYCGTWPYWLSRWTKRGTFCYPTGLSAPRVCFAKKMIEALRVDQRPTSKESGYACLVSWMWSFDAEGKLRFFFLHFEKKVSGQRFVPVLSSEQRKMLISLCNISCLYGSVRKFFQKGLLEFRSYVLLRSE
jgi:hypothetical protein